MVESGAGEIALQLRALVALVNDLAPILKTTEQLITVTVVTVPGDPMPSSDFLWH